MDGDRQDFAPRVNAPRRRVALLGGTFDPPHMGHLAIARGLLACGAADHVLLAPAALPPHKLGRVATPFETRLALARLAILGEPGLSVEDLESRRLPLPSYTIDTLRELSRSRPEDLFVLAIGADSLKELHTWREAPAIAAGWPIATYPRAGVEVGIDDLLPHWPPEDAARLLATLLPLPAHAASSTAAREAARAGLPLEGLLPAAVAAEVARLGLYRWPPPGPRPPRAAQSAISSA